MDDALIDKICGHIAKGNYVETSCGAAGIAKRSFYTWAQQGQTDSEKGRDTIFARFVERLQRAFDEAEVALVAEIREGQADRNWMRLAWILERTRQGRFGQRQTIEHEVSQVQGPTLPVHQPETHAEWLALVEAERRLLAAQAQEAEFQEVK